MAANKKSSKSKSMQKKGNTLKFAPIVKPVFNDHETIPIEIKRDILSRHKVAVELTLTEDKLMQAKLETPDETRKRVELTTEIAKKLGIADELTALRALKVSRLKRTKLLLKSTR